jgi:hypothetical protein
MGIVIWRFPSLVHNIPALLIYVDLWHPGRMCTLINGESMGFAAVSPHRLNSKKRGFVLS